MPRDKPIIGVCLGWYSINIRDDHKDFCTNILQELFHKEKNFTREEPETKTTLASDSNNHVVIVKELTD